LDLLNNDVVMDFAQALASRVLNDDRGAAPEAQVDAAFRLAYGRTASAEDQKSAAAFFQRQVPIMAARLAKGAESKLPMPAKIPEGMDPARAAAFVDLCQMLLASNEFLYIN
jgi:hypothetical protein